MLTGIDLLNIDPTHNGMPSIALVVIPATCFGHSCGRQGGTLRRVNTLRYYKIYVKLCTCKIFYAPS
jgi:hypothetical protein